MNSLYPPIEPNRTLTLNAGALHRVYVEESGNANGIPVIFLHGGPGSGSSENHRRYFNPERFRVIIFDQRGCNRSSPQGAVQENTTTDLIADMERIRAESGIDRWLVYGGSWGATLALRYAQTHPARVAGMILRGTFLARSQDLHWFLGGGAARVFPDYWEEAVAVIPEPERTDLVRAFHRRLHGDDAGVREQAARAWSKWSTRLVTWLMTGQPGFTLEAPDTATIINEVRIETHYALNRYFIRENQILDELHKLPDVPVTIIHGRRDLTCTLDASWEVHRGIPGSRLVIVHEGGHLASEAAMSSALVGATNDFAELLR